MGESRNRMYYSLTLKQIHAVEPRTAAEAALADPSRLRIFKVYSPNFVVLIISIVLGRGNLIEICSKSWPGLAESTTTWSDRNTAS